MSFSATQISGLQVWYDGADPNNTQTYPADNASISTWKNKATTGTTYDATQYSSYQAATFKLSNHGLYFNGSTVFQTNYTAQPTTETMFIVFNNASPSQNNATILAGPTGARAIGAGFSGVINSDNAVGFLRNMQAWGPGTAGGTYTTGTNATITTTINGQAVTISVGSSATTTGTFATSGGAAGMKTFLGRDIDGGFNYSGYFLELLIFDTVLSATDISTVQSYLYTKWNVNNGVVQYTLPAPTAIIPTVSSYQVSLAFTAPTGTPTNYQYSTDGGANFTTPSPAVTTSPLVITGLINGTTYNVQVKTVNASGVGAASSSVTVIPTASTPGAPTSLVATAGISSVSIAFTSPSGTISNYQYSLNGGAYGAFSPAQTTSPIAITGLAPGTYNVVLKAINGNGAGTASSSVAVTSRTGIPTAPTSLVATAGSTLVSIAFTPPVDTVTNYKYSLNGGAYVAFSPVQTTSPVYISGLTNGTAYSITLQATNTYGTSSSSASVSVTPVAAVTPSQTSLYYGADYHYLVWTGTSNTALGQDVPNGFDNAGLTYPIYKGLDGSYYTYNLHTKIFKLSADKTTKTFVATVASTMQWMTTDASGNIYSCWSDTTNAYLSVSTSTTTSSILFTRPLSEINYYSYFACCASGANLYVVFGSPASNAQTVTIYKYDTVAKGAVSLLVTINSPNTNPPNKDTQFNAQTGITGAWCDNNNGIYVRNSYNGGNTLGYINLTTNTLYGLYERVGSVWGLAIDKRNGFYFMGVNGSGALAYFNAYTQTAARIKNGPCYPKGGTGGTGDAGIEVEDCLSKGGFPGSTDIPSNSINTLFYDDTTETVGYYGVYNSVPSSPLYNQGRYITMSYNNPDNTTPTTDASLILTTLTAGTEVQNKYNSSTNLAKGFVVSSNAVSYTPSVASYPSVAISNIAAYGTSVTHMTVEVSPVVSNSVTVILNAYNGGIAPTVQVSGALISASALITIPGITSPTLSVQSRPVAGTGTFTDYGTLTLVSGNQYRLPITHLTEFLIDTTGTGGGGGGGGGDALACFLAGTRLLTQNGFKAIETFENTDYLVTSDNRTIDFQLYKTTVHKTDETSAPYKVDTHAFGPNLPMAPLFLSPSHKLQLQEGLWISPEVAVKTNSRITQCTPGETVTYYHVACENYLRDNVIAEGIVSESFGTFKTLKGEDDVYTWNAARGGYTRKRAVSPLKMTKA